MWERSSTGCIYYKPNCYRLDVTTDGTLQDKNANAISDEVLLSQFRKIEKLPDDKKKLVKEFLGTFIFKANLQKQLAS